jgi:hypothetical protein
MSDFNNINILNNRMMAQFVRNNVIYTSDDHWVFASKDNGNSWEKICVLEHKNRTWLLSLKSQLLRTEFIRRIRRNLGINNLVVLKSGTVIIQYDGIYRFDGTKKYARKVFSFDIDNIYGPMKNGLAVDDSTGNLYFGEYNNERPYSVRIVKGTDDGRTWRVCYQFQSGKIKHIHSIVPDPYRKRIWICTGDNDLESNLFFTDNDFSTIEFFGGGSQLWRMVSLIPTENSLIWGTDAGRDVPNAINYIYRWDFTRKRVEQLQEIVNPAYYTTMLSDGSMYIGTTVEETDKGGAADLWESRDGLSWLKSLSLKFSPSGRKVGTRYATIILPLGDASVHRVYFTPVNVLEHDFRLLSYRPS